MFKLAKRSITALLALALIFSMATLFACSQTENDNENNNQNDNDDQVFSTTPMVSWPLVLRADGTVWVLDSVQTEESMNTDFSLAKQIAGLDNIVYIAGRFALRDDGTVWEVSNIEWLFDVSNLAQLLTTQIQELSDIVEVSSDWEQTLALQSDGTVWSWGRNFFGQLGDGTTEDRDTPKQVQGLPPITKVVATWAQSFALCENGTVWAWGWGMNQNASPTDNEEQWMALVPMEIPSLSPIDSMSSDGSDSVIFICEKGQIYGFEDSDHRDFSQWTGKYNNIAATTGEPPISLCDQGNLWLWNRNAHPTNPNIPPLMEFREQLLGVENIVAIASYNEAERHMSNWGEFWARTSVHNGLFLCEDGYLWRYRVCLDTTPLAPTLGRVEGLEGIVAVQTGDVTAFAFAEDGTLWTWAGVNDDTWYGGLTGTPQRVEFRASEIINDEQANG